jgi:subtilisin family serine protease
MDMRLQRLVAWRQHGKSKPATAGTAADEVAVIAKVTDVEEFEAMAEVTPGVVVGGTAEDGTVIVTARIPVARLQNVRSQEFVVSLKAAQHLSHQLEATVREIQARPDDLPQGDSHGGQGVVVGIVDIGCDFAHQNFQAADGTTRIKKLWDQNARGRGEPDFAYGTVHSANAINVALAAGDPYRALGYGPDPSEPAHGTHVMDIAAGNGRGTGVPGVAPESDLLFVDVANSDVPWSGSQVVGSNFGDSVQLLEALAFIFRETGQVPCVVNISLGTNGGPHDGTTLVEQGIDRLLAQAPNRSVCIAASNSFADGIHAAGTVPANGSRDLAWIVAPGDGTQNEMELWYPGNAALRLELVSPQGQSVGILGPGESGTASQPGQAVRSQQWGQYHWRLPLSRRLLRPLDPSANRYDWGPGPVPCLDRARRQRPVNIRRAAGQHPYGRIDLVRHNTIVVGSYDAHKPARPLSWFSSAGPTRDGRQKPEVSAPGHNVVAAASRSTNGTTRMSGTSMASPAVTGCVALLLAEAHAHNRSLATEEIRSIVMKAVRSDPPPAGLAWNDRYGGGRLSAVNILRGL